MALTEDTLIARHEAAHAIAALEFRGMVEKIDLDGQSSPTGLGAAHVALLHKFFARIRFAPGSVALSKNHKN